MPILPIFDDDKLLWHGWRCWSKLGLKYRTKDPTNGRCHRRGWRRLDTGQCTHCLQSTCKHVGWLLLCYYTVSTINMHVHGAWWEDGCYYALPLARKCFERNTQHSGIVYDPTNLHHKSTHNKHNAKFTKYIKLYCVPISVHRVDTFKIDRIWLLRALALLHWSRSVAGPK